ncbi:MAG TPA: SRPBCC domain-containing protein [Edaphobacter sp.]|nr:SRPBCC domain-containing protein [Edaphobacter sp.]
MSAAIMSSATEKAQHELHITRVFDAPRELVWRVMTDPEHIKHWSGPRQFEATNVENDQRPGGKWRLCLHTDGFDTGDGVLRQFDLRQGGENLEVVEPERLVYTFKWEDNPGLSSNVETVVTITLEEEGGKTTMNFRQAFFVTSADRDGHVRGWNSSFDRLEDYLGEVKER